MDRRVPTKDCSSVAFPAAASGIALSTAATTGVTKTAETVAAARSHKAVSIVSVSGG